MSIGWHMKIKKEPRRSGRGQSQDTAIVIKLTNNVEIPSHRPGYITEVKRFASPNIKGP